LHIGHEEIQRLQRALGFHDAPGAAQRSRVPRGERFERIGFNMRTTSLATSAGTAASLTQLVCHWRVNAASVGKRPAVTRSAVRFVDNGCPAAQQRAGACPLAASSNAWW
jgi:hypothetical protein